MHQTSFSTFLLGNRAEREIRTPNPETRKKAERRNPQATGEEASSRGGYSGLLAGFVGLISRKRPVPRRALAFFGFRISAFFRTSDFGLRTS
jgi:hypothetical protein